MKEYKLYELLHEFLGDNISSNEIESFMYFLKACGAYDEFIKEMDMEKLKLANIYYSEECYLLYYNIISISLEWKETNSGVVYWKIINNLHQSILIIKCKNKLLDKSNKLYDVLAKRYIYCNDLRYLMDECSRLNKEDKKLKSFINKLYSYLKDNNFIK